MTVGDREFWAVLPVKRFDGAKQRLDGALDPAERRALAEAMVRDVLSTLVATKRLSGILVVTNDSRAAGYARRIGASVIGEPMAAGQSAAIARAARHLARRPRTVLLTVPGDVPLIKVDDIESLMIAHRDSNLTLAPARGRFGTNGLVVTLPTTLRFRFGADSHRLHHMAAHDSGLGAHDVAIPNLDLDIDTPDDLGELLRRKPAGYTAGAIAKMRLASRIDERNPGSTELDVIL